MFNLLLPGDKATIYKEYVLRLTVVILLGLFSTLMAGAIFLLPSYIWLRISEKEILDKKTGSEQAHVADPHLNEVLAEAKLKMSGLHATEATSVIDLINGIVEARGTGIKLSGIDFASVDGKINFHISGVSATRDSLVAFSKRLQANPLYITVDVPISNFVKDRNIAFSLDLKGK